MSINSFSSMQSLVNKRGAAAAAGPVSITNLAAPGPISPFYYLTPTTTIKSANNQIIGCTCVVTNQTSPYTFMNGTYIMSSSCLTTQNSNGGTLAYAFSGDSSADIMQSPSTYNSSGSYTGSVATVTSGTTIYGEWMQVQLPYTLTVTTYSIISAVPSGGPSWATMVPKSFYLCGSNDGSTWTTIDNRTGFSASTSVGPNHFTAPTQSVGYKYFRLVGTQIGTGTFLRMGCALGIQGSGM